MNGTQRTVAIVGLWICAMGALTVAMSNFFLPPTVVVVIAVLLVAAAVAATYFITRPPLRV